jgi:molybdopterin synthase catalytic subunit
MQIRIVADAFDPHTDASAFAANRTDIGAMATFVGYCRDSTAGQTVTALHLEQYPGFTEKEIGRFSEEICSHFDVADALIVHRVGTMRPGEPIVLVAVLAPHRAAAFEACQTLMDYLKTDAPLWKRETGPERDRWVEPSPTDLERRVARARKYA